MGELVSIITPAYNCGKFISESIDSVLKQSYKNWEMVIVDDGSTDDTKDVVRTYVENDPRIRYFRFDKNSGAAAARNKAMALAGGQYMAFLDSDDVWHKRKLDKQMTFMKENNFNFTCTSYEQMDEGGSSLGKIIRAKERTNYNGILLSCPVGNSTVMYNVGELGKFVVPDIKKRNDDALWLQILKREENIYGLSDVLMRYRVRPDSISSNKLELVRHHWKLYREIECLSITRSVFHLFYWAFLKISRIK